MNAPATADRVDRALHGLLALAAELDGQIEHLEAQLADLRRERSRLVAGTRRAFAGDKDAAGT